jgi:hypothetical protein
MAGGREKTLASRDGGQEITVCNDIWPRATATTKQFWRKGATDRGKN